MLNVLADDLRRRSVDLAPTPCAVWSASGAGIGAGAGCRDKPAAAADKPQGCNWQAGVFERPFQRFVWPDACVSEGCCCGAGDKACGFQIAPHFRA